MNVNEKLRALPKVDELIHLPEMERFIADTSRAVVVDKIREAIEHIRTSILNGEDVAADDASVVSFVKERLAATDKRSLRRVINGTGILLHTNLGRAKLADRIAANVVRVVKGYSTLEYNLEDGKRGSRHDHVSELIASVVGAEAAMIVNNNASATLLCLVALAHGKEVVVSRGELVEIGGSFRVPEIMQTGGTILKEVGTTNKTHSSDYENAIGENTAAILKVHTSNYRIVGFTSDVDIKDLSILSSKYGLPMIYDMGSGLLVDLQMYGVDEPTVGKALQDGADVVLFSGDKLLGGPQAGVIVGKKEYIDKMKMHALARVVRVDKMTIAAIEETFRIYRDKKQAFLEIPVLSMISQSQEALIEKAKLMIDALGEVSSNVEFSWIEEIGRVGGGSAPMLDLKTVAVALRPLKMSVSDLEILLRNQEIPIIARIAEGKLLLDMRTISDDEISIVAKVILDIFS
ncbi:MAG: L-seryl-tRNA(Sec) selenium transferase [Clostridia bacterium]|nr:L-seryl-tRNA(Sec) selenium transferase [Clostridia bacterium]